MKVSEYAVKHPAVIAMLLIVLVVFGLVSVFSMNIEFMADVSAPSVMVVSIYPGASAEDMEQDVTSILEDDFVTLPDFKSVESESSNSVSFITITFQDGVDPHDRITEVRDRINKLMEKLPDGLSGIPDVFVGGVEMLSVFSFSVNGGGDAGTVTRYVEDTLKPRLTSIPGVSSVTVSGGKELRVNVMLRLADLAARGISALTIYQVLNASNVALPAGNSVYNQQNIAVRYSGELASLQDIKELPVGSTGDGVIIRLQDVADVTLAYPDEEILVTDGEQPLILVEVMKRSDGNTVEIARKAKSILKDATEQTGGALDFEIISDDSRTISASLKTVVTSGVMGIIMAVVVIFLFLGDIRATLIIALSIPLSILFTFVGMKVTGITINLMSLSGMVVALGMVVDGSIVMIEQVYRYYAKRNSAGQPLYPVEHSIFAGSAEVGGSIFASTATTVVVFIPIAMLAGLVGMILKDVALTLIMALVASLVSAVVVVPFLMRLLFKPEGPAVRKKPSLVSRGMAWLEVKYKGMLGWSLRSWKFILFIALCILAATLFIATSLGIAFIPSTDNSDFYIDVEFPAGYTLERTQARVEEISRLLEKNVPEVQSVVFFSGTSQGFGTSGNAANSGYAHVVLVPVAERKRDIHDIILLMQRAITSNIPDVTVKVSNGGFDKLLGYVSGGGGYGLTLVSEDMDTLYATAVELENFLRTDPDVVSVEMDTSFDTETLAIDMVHDYMSSLGVTSYEAGVTAAILFQGMDAGRFKDSGNDTRYDIRLFSDITGEKITVDDFADIQVVSAAGIPVSFANISQVKAEGAVSQINHTDRAKTITVSASLVSEDTAGVSRRVNQWLKDNPLPPGVSSKAGGIMELIGDSLPSLVTALLIAWFLVYTVMVLQFEKFRQPFIIMATIPFCLIGVVLGLLLFGSTMSLLALLGVISLGGVVVNNGIILIDYINLLRRRGGRDEDEDLAVAQANEDAVPGDGPATGFAPENETEENLRECVVRGSASRLRPIFMTTLTTMLGVVPMAMSKGEGAEIYAPLGQAIAGGLLTSTLITLFIIPVLYFVSERRKLRKRAGKASSKATTVLLVCLVLLCVPGTVLAQDENVVSSDAVPLPGSVSGGAYTLEALTALMEASNPDILKAQEEYRRALLDVKDAKAGYQPTVDLSLGGTYMVNPMIGEISAATGSLGTLPIKNPLTGDIVMQPLPASDLVIYEGMPNAMYSFQLDIQQPVFTWGKITNAVKIYSSAAEVRRLQLSSRRKQLSFQLEANLAALHYLVQMEELLGSQMQYAQQLVRLSEDAERNGVILRQAVLEAQMQAALVPVTLANVTATKANTLQDIRQMTGLPGLEAENIAFVPPSSSYESLAGRERAELEAAALNPSQDALAILDALYDVAYFSQKVAEGSVYWKPDIALQVSVGFSGDMEKLFKGEAAAKDDLVADFTIGFKTTVWDGGKKLNQIKRTQSEAVSADIDRSATESAILKELRSQLNALEMASLRIQYQQLKIQTAAADVARAEQQFVAGYGSERDVLQARISEITERITLLQERTNLAVAACTVMALTDVSSGE